MKTKILKIKSKTLFVYSNNSSTKPEPTDPTTTMMTSTVTGVFRSVKQN